MKGRKFKESALYLYPNYNLQAILWKHPSDTYLKHLRVRVTMRGAFFEVDLDESNENPVNVEVTSVKRHPPTNVHTHSQPQYPFRPVPDDTVHQRQSKQRVFLDLFNSLFVTLFVKPRLKEGRTGSCITQRRLRVESVRENERGLLAFWWIQITSKPCVYRTVRRVYLCQLVPCQSD